MGDFSVFDCSSTFFCRLNFTLSFLFLIKYYHIIFIIIVFRLGSNTSSPVSSTVFTGEQSFYCLYFVSCFYYCLYRRTVFLLSLLRLLFLLLALQENSLSTVFTSSPVSTTVFTGEQSFYRLYFVSCFYYCLYRRTVFLLTLLRLLFLLLALLLSVPASFLTIFCYCVISFMPFQCASVSENARA